MASQQVPFPDSPRSSDTFPDRPWPDNTYRHSHTTCSQDTLSKHTPFPKTSRQNCIGIKTKCSVSAPWVLNALNMNGQEGKAGSSEQTLLDQREFLSQSSVTIASTVLKADLKPDSMDSSSFRSTNMPGFGL